MTNPRTGGASRVATPRPSETIVGRIQSLARAEPSIPAVSTPTETITRAELDEFSERLAAFLVERGVVSGDRVLLALPNSIEFAVALTAAWKAGATVVVLNPRLAAPELEALGVLADPVIVWDEVDAVRQLMETPASAEATEQLRASRRRIVSRPWKILGSGGSTGRPKLIVSEAAATVGGAGFEAERPMNMYDGEAAVITGPLSHNGPFLSLVAALITGAPAVLTGKFDPAGLLQLIDRHRPGWMYVVPTMMSRVLKLPIEVRDSYDVSSLRTVTHMGAICPAWVKQGWIDWIGAEKLVEVYTSTEGLALFVCRATEWLARPGTVGRAVAGEVQIRDEEGTVLGPNEIGRIWARRGGDAPPYTYVGSTSSADAEGWETLGDVGRLDADGYLYIEERESDMILVAGSNVYPAEVESALALHPRVEDVCVIGLPDEDRGQVPHAIVYTKAVLDLAELHEIARERLAPYKRPHSYEFTPEPIRDAAGKVRRARLIAERTARPRGQGS